ncbi:MAG: hypothetical protein NTZ80_03600 [Patescibacteria group bacterium]|nr:hypothetical protein [Patescibacteria group bacterium]
MKQLTKITKRTLSGLLAEAVKKEGTLFGHTIPKSYGIFVISPRAEDQEKLKKSYLARKKVYMDYSESENTPCLIVEVGRDFISVKTKPESEPIHLPIARLMIA